MDDLRVQVAEIDQRSRSNTHRLDDMHKKLDDYGDVIASIKLLAAEQGHIKDDVGEIKTDLKAITDRPGRRWEELVSTVLKIVVGALLALAFTRMGIG